MVIYGKIKEKAFSGGAGGDAPCGGGWGGGSDMHCFGHRSKTLHFVKVHKIKRTGF